MNKWVVCIIALIIGMLMYNMLSNVCGCNNVEGNSDNSDTTKRGCMTIPGVPSSSPSCSSYSNEECPDNCFNHFDSFQQVDTDWKSGKTFGAVYYPGDNYASVISKSYSKFIHENAFDPQLFKSILSMEKEVVEQVSNLVSPETKLYGSLTSGGTESIFLSLLSARDWSKEKKGIESPEVILSSTAHPAFLKALRFLKIKPVIIDVDSDLTFDLKIVEQNKLQIRHRERILV